MVTGIPFQLRRAVIAGLVSSLSWVLIAGASALPASAAPSQPAKSGNLVFDLLTSVRGALTPPTTPTAPVTTPTTTPVTTPTAAGASTLTSPLDVGSKGAPVKALEVRLDTLHYFVGPIDETYDAETAQAVMAFQKANRLDRTGKVDQKVWTAMATAKDPAPLIPGGASHRVEVDIDRQVLFLYEGGKLSKILPVSTGNGADYCEGGSCGVAVTPTGDFAVYRQGTGWEYGPLGGLYNPQYFKGGYAIHGSLSVPAEPASHGCIRIPMGAAEWFPHHVSNGTPVHVR